MNALREKTVLLSVEMEEALQEAITPVEGKYPLRVDDEELVQVQPNPAPQPEPSTDYNG